MTQKLARRMDRLQASPVRDILAVASQPGMISFAGGLPATDALPSIDSVSIDSASLQYGASEGDQALRKYVANDLQQRGFDVDENRVLIVSGSQQGIDLVAKLIVEQGTCVAVESPTYLAALQMFTLFGAQYVPFSIDALQSEVPGVTLEDVLDSELLYINPTFQNPSSTVYTSTQRRTLATLCDDEEILLFEDDPYRELYYESCDRQPVCSMLRRTSWVYQSSFSKTIAPGLRLGYLTCSANLYPHLLKLKQAADLHSNRISQSLLLTLVNDPLDSLRLQEARASYRAKRDSFNSLLHQYFDSLATWEVPVGGLFYWLTLKTPVPIDTRLLLQDAIDAGVAFMPGEPFFIDSTQAKGHLRLNFSHAPVELFEQGLAQLSSIIAIACQQAADSCQKP